MKSKVLIATLAAGAAAAGAAFAAIPDSGGLIQGCYKAGDASKANGAALSVIDSEQGGSCKDGYADLTFNQQGPQGPQGPPGPTGPPGPGLHSSAKLVVLDDNAAGNALGWHPPYSGGALPTIQDPDLSPRSVALGWVRYRIEDEDFPEEFTQFSFSCVLRTQYNQDFHPDDHSTSVVARLIAECPVSQEGASLVYVLMNP